MAFTEQELDLAKQVKEQGGSRQDFLEILDQMRTQTPELFEPKEQVIGPGTPTAALPEQLATPITGEPVLTLERLTQIGEEAREREGFELKEGEVVEEERPGILETIGGKIEERKEFLLEDIPEFEEKGATGRISAAIQTGGEVIGGFGDLVFEGLIKPAGRLIALGAEDTIVGDIGSVIKEGAIDSAKAIAETDLGKAGLNKIGEGFEAFDEWRNESDANENIARNIEAVFEVGSIFGIGKGIQVGQKVIREKIRDLTQRTKELLTTKLEKKEIVRLSNKNIRDNVEVLTAPGKKVKPDVKEDFGKIVSENIDDFKQAIDFDDLSLRVNSVGQNAINTLNTSLQGITKLHKGNAPTREVLKEMIKNADKVDISKVKVNSMKKLLKKLDAEGLTLSEMNGIKKDINNYTRAWTASGLEGAGLKAGTVRDKYSEVATFIETAAAREGIPDVKELNRDWFVADTMSQLLAEQARRSGKLRIIEDITKPGIFTRTTKGIRNVISAPFTKAEKIDTNLKAIEENIGNLLDNISSSHAQRIRLK